MTFCLNVLPEALPAGQELRSAIIKRPPASKNRIFVHGQFGTENALRIKSNHLCCATSERLFHAPSAGFSCDERPCDGPHLSLSQDATQLSLQVSQAQVESHSFQLYSLFLCSLFRIFTNTYTPSLFHFTSLSFTAPKFFRSSGDLPPEDQPISEPAVKLVAVKWEREGVFLCGSSYTCLPCRYWARFWLGDTPYTHCLWSLGNFVARYPPPPPSIVHCKFSMFHSLESRSICGACE